MKDYYKNSKREFINYIRKNPNCSKEEWDEYAHENSLFSAFTLLCHEITYGKLKKIKKQSANEFEFLKERYIIISKTKIKILLNKIRKVLNFKEKEQKSNG